MKRKSKTTKTNPSSNHIRILKLKAIIEEQEVTSLQNKNLFFDVNAKKKVPPSPKKNK